MKPTLWNPFQDMLDMQERMNKAFNDGFGASLTNLQLPATDVFEENGKLVVKAALPDFTEKDVEVHVTDSGVEIKAEHNEDKKEQDKKRKYYVRESRSGAFYRFIALPSGADKDKAEAHFKDGVLQVVVPLSEPPKPKKLTVKTKK